MLEFNTKDQVQQGITQKNHRKQVSKMREEIENTIKTSVSAKEVSGANVLVIKDGKELCYAEGGLRDIEGNVPFSRDTIIRLYSMSKPVTSAAVMMLVDRGQIDLCESVGRYIDTFSGMTVSKNGVKTKASRDIAFHDLMSMTSGTVYPGMGSDAERESAALFSEAEHRLGTGNEMSTMEFAERTGKNTLAFDPGETFRYGTSADILGALVEKISGMSFGAFLQKEFFDPLEMKDTGFYVKAENRSRLAKIYRSGNDSIREDKTCHLAISYDMDHAPAFESGGAGLCSTLDDYSRFAGMLMQNGFANGRRFLSEEAVKYMTNGELQPWQQPGFDNWTGLQGFSYGNLMRIMKEPGRALLFGSKGEYGWDGWLGAYFSNDPANKLTILMGMQKIDAGTWHLTRRIRNLVYSHLHDNE